MLAKDAVLAKDDVPENCDVDDPVQELVTKLPTTPPPPIALEAVTKTLPLPSIPRTLSIALSCTLGSYIYVGSVQSIWIVDPSLA